MKPPGQPPAACCDMMARAINPGCDQHKDSMDCPDVLVTRTSDGRLGTMAKITTGYTMAKITTVERANGTFECTR